jgi:hypothetical protein
MAVCKVFQAAAYHQKSFGSSIRIFTKDMNFVVKILYFNLRDEL